MSSLFIISIILFILFIFYFCLNSCSLLFLWDQEPNLQLLFRVYKWMGSFRKGIGDRSFTETQSGMCGIILY